MNSIKLAEQICENAIFPGFDDCGIISLEELDGYVIDKECRLYQKRIFVYKTKLHVNLDYKDREWYIWQKQSLQVKLQLH